MNAVSSIEPAKDDILLLLPQIQAGSEEHQLRAKLRSRRNTAVALATRTECSAARCLAWMASDYVHAYLYTAADNAALEQIDRLVTRLMLTALQAEQMADEGIVA